MEIQELYALDGMMETYVLLKTMQRTQTRDGHLTSRWRQAGLKCANRVGVLIGYGVMAWNDAAVATNPLLNSIMLMANTQIMFEQFLDAELPDGGWKRDFSDTHFVERYLRGYLILSRMQQTEITKIAKTMEKQQKKTQKQTSQLMQEIKKLNSILIDLVRKQKQLDLDFRALTRRNESVLKAHFSFISSSAGVGEEQ